MDCWKDIHLAGTIEKLKIYAWKAQPEGQAETHRLMVFPSKVSNYFAVYRTNLSYAF